MLQTIQTLQDKGKIMMELDFNVGSREQQLKGVQDYIDFLEDLGYSVDGLSNDDIINLAEDIMGECDSER